MYVYGIYKLDNQNIHYKMDHIEIRRVTQNDIDQLQAISKQTFLGTFSAGNTADNMEKYLQERFSVETLTAEFNNKSSEFYFAILDRNIIGYLKLNYGQSQTELKNDNALEIERIYVLKEFHGKNVGQLLYEKAIQIAKQLNVDFIWLGVWEHNARAIHFYRKNGFIEFDKHIFRLGNDNQIDILMKLPLKGI